LLSLTPLLSSIVTLASGDIILTIFTLQFFIIKDSRNLSSISSCFQHGVEGFVLVK